MSSNTPFGPTDQPRAVVDNISNIPAEPITVNPAEAHSRAPKDDDEALEFMRIRRLSCHFDRLTLCHVWWRGSLRLSPDEQTALAQDFFKMISLPMPWFSSQFTLFHAQIIAAFFDNRQVWFDGKVVA